MASKEPVAPEKTTREDKPTFHAVLNEFLRRNRVLIIAIFVVVIAAVIVAAVWTIVDRKISASAARDLERLETSLEAWSSTSGPEADAKAEELLSDLDGVASKYRGRYAGQKALVLAGRVYGSRKDWASAEKKFLEAADLKKDSILSSFALQEAARSAEERQDLETAIKLWNRVVESSSGLTVGLPHAYFVLGTLYEESKQYSEASARYEKLIASYPDNDWTKLARDRIILLKSQGLLP